MNGFIAEEHWRGQYVTVRRQANDTVSIAVAGPRGAHKSYVELDAEQPMMPMWSARTPAGKPRPCGPPPTGSSPWSTPARREAWRQEDHGQWRADYPNYAAQSRVPA